MIQQTSLSAFQSIQPQLGHKQSMVYNTIKFLKECDNKAIANCLEWPINCVTPRVKELRDYGLIIHKGYIENKHYDEQGNTKTMKAMTWSIHENP